MGECGKACTPNNSQHLQSSSRSFSFRSASHRRYLFITYEERPHDNIVHDARSQQVIRHKHQRKCHRKGCYPQRLKATEKTKTYPGTFSLGCGFKTRRAFHHCSVLAGRAKLAFSFSSFFWNSSSPEFKLANGFLKKMKMRRGCAIPPKQRIRRFIDLKKREQRCLTALYRDSCAC